MVVLQQWWIVYQPRQNQSIWIINWTEEYSSSAVPKAPGYYERGEFFFYYDEGLGEWCKNLLTWRAATGETAFWKTAPTSDPIAEQEYFDNGLLMVAFIRAGVELAFWNNGGNRYQTWICLLRIITKHRW